MQLVNTGKARRFIGELTRGMEVGKALTRLLQTKTIRCGYVRIMGHLSEIEVAIDGPKGPQTVLKKISKPCQIVSCEGLVTELGGKFDPVLYTLVSFEGETGVLSLGGVLQSAVVLSCDILIEAFDDCFVRKKQDPKLGLPVWESAFSQSQEEPTGSLSVRGSAQGPPPQIPSSSHEEEFEEEEIVPSPGDTINHFKFGRCLVLKYDARNDSIQIKMPSERTATLKVQFLAFSLLEELEDGTKLYRAVSRRA